MGEWNPTKTRTSWYPVIAMVMLVVHMVLIFAVTFACHKVTDISNPAVLETAGGGEIINSRSAADIHIKLVRGEDGSLRFLAYHEMEWLKRYDLISDGAEVVEADGQTVYEAKCFNASVSFTITEDHLIKFQSSKVRDYGIPIQRVPDELERYVIDAALLVVAEFVIAVAVGLYRTRNENPIIDRDAEMAQKKADGQ